MVFYHACLGGLLAVNSVVLWSRYRSKTRDGTGISEKLTQCNRYLYFFVPYIMAVAADWLQGPHIYAMYKYEKQLPENTVAALYATGFASGGLSAAFVGSLADQFGRKRACLTYCALYLVTCMSMLSDDLTILLLGRVAGGIGTTLLFSVFEAWLISDYHEQGRRSSSEGLLEPASADLDSIFTAMTTLSCIVAILSGVVGDALVQASGTRSWPFIAAMFCCVGAAWAISVNWRENYGSTDVGWGNQREKAPTERFDFRNAKILTLGFITCVFEGTMYLFIFFWSSALQTARKTSGFDGELPFGLIFSNFMCAMLTGSTLYGLLPTQQGSVHSLMDVLTKLFVLTSFCLGLAANMDHEYFIFVAFCIIESCIGVYFPAMASLKNQLVNDQSRGRTYSLLRAPLNVFVIVAHCLDKEGSQHRNNVFLTCASLLLVVFLVARRYIN